MNIFRFDQDLIPTNYTYYFIFFKWIWQIPAILAGTFFPGSRFSLNFFPRLGLEPVKIYIQT